jgi:hypothetical protein
MMAQHPYVITIVILVAAMKQALLLLEPGPSCWVGRSPELEDAVQQVGSQERPGPPAWIGLVK